MPVIERRPMPRQNVRIHPQECGLNPTLRSSYEGASYEVETLHVFLSWLGNSPYTVGEVMDAMSYNGSIVIRGIGGLTLRMYSEPTNYDFRDNIVLAVGPEGSPPTCRSIEPDARLHAIWRLVESNIQPSRPASPRREYGFIESLNHLPVSPRKVTHNQPELCDRFALLSDLSDYGIGVAEVRITLRDGSTRTLTEEGILDEVVVSRRSEPSQAPSSDRLRNLGRNYGSGLVGREQVSMASLSPGEVVLVDEAPQSAPSLDQILDTLLSSSEGTHEY